MPSVSAAIWLRTVLVPWPNSVLETSTRTRPSAVLRRRRPMQIALTGARKPRAVHKRGNADSFLDRALFSLARILPSSRDNPSVRARDRAFSSSIASSNFVRDRRLAVLEEIATAHFTGDSPRFARCGPCAAPSRRGSAARRIHEMRRAAAHSSPRPWLECARWANVRAGGVNRAARQNDR